MTEQHRARKRFGQNFLVDQTIIEKIVAAISPQPTDKLIEIGPGLGALTTPLLQRCPSLTCIELDRDLAAILLETFADQQDFTLIEHDALSFDFQTLGDDEKPLRITGNLPYNISSPLIFHLLSYSTLISDMHFMLQKEVVDRMAAGPGTKAYGRLSIMVQYRCQVQPLFAVPPTAFKPAPKVDSAIVKLTPYSALPVIADDETAFARLVKICFQQRRKTLRNSLKLMYSADKIDDTFDTMALKPTIRPEEVSVKDFVQLSNHLQQLPASD